MSAAPRVFKSTVLARASGYLANGQLQWATENGRRSGEHHAGNCAVIAKQKIHRLSQARAVRGSGKKKPSAREGSDLLAVG